MSIKQVNGKINEQQLVVQKDRVVELFFIYFLLVNSDKNSG